jgi:hypothetical protein
MARRVHLTTCVSPLLIGLRRIANCGISESRCEIDARGVAKSCLASHIAGQSIQDRYLSAPETMGVATLLI